MPDNETRTPLLAPQPPLPTVKIKSDDTSSGFIVINESDFDKATMDKYVEPKAKTPAAPPAS